MRLPWHMRLGHLTFKILQVSQSLIDVLPHSEGMQGCYLNVHWGCIHSFRHPSHVRSGGNISLQDI